MTLAEHDDRRVSVWCPSCGDSVRVVPRRVAAAWAADHVCPA